LFLRWRPKAYGQFTTLAHPTHGTPEPHLTPVGMFGGYPLVQAPAGLVIADDQVNPFSGAFRGLHEPVWHRDVQSRLGVPTVQRNLLFTNVGGENALSALVAMDTSTGSTAWEYAPQGLPGEPVKMLHGSTVRPMTESEKTVMKQVVSLPNQRGKKPVVGVPAGQSSVRVDHSTPTIDAMHGHWLNPGLVPVGDRVYGQVGSSIVAVSQQNGQLIWEYDIHKFGNARSIAASKDHLFVSLDKQLIALSLKDGKLEWSQEMPRAGTISIASGRIIVAMGPTDKLSADGGKIMVFEPDRREAKDGKETVRPVPPPQP
jgi:outer membrane protein assembly factor BamB